MSINFKFRKEKLIAMLGNLDNEIRDLTNIRDGLREKLDDVMDQEVADVMNEWIDSKYEPSNA